MPYRPEQLFGLVADVASYPEFLPWCLAVRIRERKADLIVADLVIGFKMVRERFTSRVSLDESHGRIDVNYLDGPFRRLDNHWIFEPHADGCEVDFFIDFEFRSRLLQRIFQPLFHEAVRRMVSAFEARAGQVFPPEPGS